MWIYFSQVTLSSVFVSESTVEGCVAVWETSETNAHFSDGYRWGNEGASAYLFPSTPVRVSTRQSDG